MNDLAVRLAELPEACWQRGRELPRLAMRKLFEKDGEAYAEWNHSLAGHEPPHAVIGPPFATPSDLSRSKAAAEEKRDELHREMVALQEEMDWLVYVAYGLVGEGVVMSPNAGAAEVGQASCLPGRRDACPTMPEPLGKEDRPFALMARAEGDFDRAIASIPSEWSADRKKLWGVRLAAIRDNEHIRRIEQPVYKRRWYRPKGEDQEFVEAFEWWLREKAEWWLEHARAGGPVELAEWRQALWADERVQAAWPVASEAYGRVEAERERKREEKLRPAERTQPGLPGFEPTPAEFGRRFKALIEEETVLAGIPAAVPYEELAERKIDVPAKVKAIRGKLNVPRERFRRHGLKGPYEWAGKDLFEDGAK